ncbi:hypothetical protein AVEN_81586-1 [Araneus ventricosus]|uniref:Uncharacterized protein n=1 Tax=Araneus ventricosus TaxID=182803 RepID=A0A4Y2FNI6_ARAVE|nr:hypothetical protein AVEN_81586-1 [Araneus ventricosus]
MIVNRVNTPCLSIRAKLNDSRCDCSSTEAGVLMVIRNHGPIPSEGDYRLKELNAIFILPTSMSENPLIYPGASHPRTGSAPRWNTVWR